MNTFAIPVESMVVTSTYVTQERLPILSVSHQYDPEDGDDWQFHCGNGDYSMSKLQLVRLSTILAIDPDVVAVSGLPAGFVATRAAVGQPWEYARA